MTTDTITNTRKKPGARDKILTAALRLIRTKGYTATTVDDLCREAGVTKGAFFHHFSSKEDLGSAAADHWSTVTGALFAAAPYHTAEDPLDRVFAYLAFRRQLIAGRIPDFTCLVGTMVQDVFDTSPAIREACRASIFGHAATLEADITAAAHARGVALPGGAASLARHFQAVLQGGFVLAKASDDPGPALDSLDHLIRYVGYLFGVAVPEENGHE